MGNPILEYNEYSKRFTEYVEFMRVRSSKEELERLCTLRGFSSELVERQGIFWIGNMSEMLVPEYMDELLDFGVISGTNNKPIFNHRWVMPIYNENKQVLNLVGYSNESDERYVYGDGKYYNRTDTLFGLENIHDAYEKGWAIVTEGITDTLSIRDLGYKNTFAMCGTRPSEYKMKLFNRLKHGVIFIHDRDKPGDRTRKIWVTNRYFRFNTPLKYKDADETLHDPEQDNREWFKECMNMAIGWIESGENTGRPGLHAEDTMI